MNELYTNTLKLPAPLLVKLVSSAGGGTEPGRCIWWWAPNGQPSASLPSSGSSAGLRGAGVPPGWGPLEGDAGQHQLEPEVMYVSKPMTLEAARAVAELAATKAKAQRLQKQQRQQPQQQQQPDALAQ